MDYKELSKKIKAWCNSPEGKEDIAKRKRWEERKKMYTLKIHDRLKMDPFLLENFLVHETKYEEMKYNKHHTMTASKIFNFIFNIWSEFGIEYKKDYELDEYGFLSGSYLYLGYKFQIFCGQGSFYRVYKGDECIFQST